MQEPNPTEPALILVLLGGFFATIKEREEEKVEPIQEQPPPTRAPSSTKELDQSDSWELYVYAIKAPATKAKYCQRLRAFLEFLGYEEGSLEEKPSRFGFFIFVLSLYAT